MIARKIITLNTLFFNAVTRRDSTYANVSCGDFQLQLHAKGGYKYLLKQGNALSSIVQKQMRTKQFDYLKIQNKLPLAHINLTTGPNNMFMKILKRYGYKIGSANINMQASPSMGLMVALKYMISMRNLPKSIQFDLIWCRKITN